MPSTSKRQSSFMKAVANNPKFAKKVGVSSKVGKDFEMADKKAKRFTGGGATSKPKPPAPVEPVTGGSSTVPMTPEREKFLKEMERRNREAREEGRRTGRSSPDMNAKGGKIMKKSDKAGRALVKKSADTMGRAMKYAKGGSIDGCATKGKTRTKYPSMKKGGMC